MDYLVTYEDDLGLQHHGILGQKWGVRRYQNEDGSLTEAGRRRLDKLDAKWAHKNYNAIYNRAYKQSKPELKTYDRKVLSKEVTKYNKSGTVSAQYALQYNRKMAELMNAKITDIRSPSGKVVKFIAKRGEIGVHMALATENYDISSLHNGVYDTGKIGYKNKTLDRM